MRPTVKSLWKFVGGGEGQGQIHAVAISNADEVVTNGIPYGCGYAWLGSPDDFRKQFKYVGELPE